MNEKHYYAMYVGEFSSQCATSTDVLDVSPLIRLKTADLIDRFVARITDNGFEPLGLHKGDYLIFHSQRWPTKELEICFCLVEDDAIIRMMDGVLAHDIALRVPRDTYKPIELTPQDFHVMGVLAGIIPRDDPVDIVTIEDLYYGVNFIG